MPYNADARLQPSAAGNQFEHEAGPKSDTKQVTAGLVGPLSAIMVNRDSRITETGESTLGCSTKEEAVCFQTMRI